LFITRIYGSYTFSLPHAQGPANNHTTTVVMYNATRVNKHIVTITCYLFLDEAELILDDTFLQTT
jgi:hypothetical protein